MSDRPEGQETSGRYRASAMMRLAVLGRFRLKWCEGECVRSCCSPGLSPCVLCCLPDEWREMAGFAPGSAREDAGEIQGATLQRLIPCCFHDLL